MMITFYYLISTHCILVSYKNTICASLQWIGRSTLMHQHQPLLLLVLLVAKAVVRQARVRVKAKARARRLLTLLLQVCLHTVASTRLLRCVYACSRTVGLFAQCCANRINERALCHCSTAVELHARCDPTGRSHSHVISVHLTVSVLVTIYATMSVTIESEQQPPDDDDMIEDIDELDDTNDGTTAATSGTGAVTVGSSGTNASTNSVRLPPVPEGAAAGVLPRVIKSLVERRGMVKKVYYIFRSTFYIYEILLLT
jgi:hypothetical protein